MTTWFKNPVWRRDSSGWGEAREILFLRQKKSISCLCACVSHYSRSPSLLDFVLPRICRSFASFNPMFKLLYVFSSTFIRSVVISAKCGATIEGLGSLRFCLLSNGPPCSQDKNKTFKPKKQINKETKRYELHKQAKATLGSGNLKLAVKLPEREDMNEWLAVNSTSVLNFTFLLSWPLWEFHAAPRPIPRSCFHVHPVPGASFVLVAIFEYRFCVISAGAYAFLRLCCSGRLFQPDQLVVWLHHRILHPEDMLCDVCWSKVCIC